MGYEPNGTMDQRARSVYKRLKCPVSIHILMTHDQILKDNFTPKSLSKHLMIWKWHRCEKKQVEYTNCHKYELNYYKPPRSKTI